MGKYLHYLAGMAKNHTVLNVRSDMAVERSLKAWIKQKERPEVPPDQLEIDHIRPVSRGGGDNPGNLEALTLIEHATKHYQAGEFYAVNLIVSRMEKSTFKAWCAVRRTL